MNYVLVNSSGVTIKSERSRYNSTRDFGKLTAGETYYVYTTESSVANGIKSFNVKSYENYTIHYVDNSATPVTIKPDVIYNNLYGATVTANESDMASIEYNGKTYYYESGNTDIVLGTGTNEITLVYKTQTPATITVKYWNNAEPAVEIKDATTIDSYVGATDVCATGENFPTYITYSDVKYQYSSGNTPIATVTGDATINLVYTPAPQFTCTVNAKSGETILASPSKTVYSGEGTRVYYKKAYENAGIWYMTPANGSYPSYAHNFSSVTANASFDVSTYVANKNIVYFSEVEEMNLEGSFAAEGAQYDRYSNGVAKRLYSSGGATPSSGSWVYTDDIPAGVYTITLWARNQSSSQTSTIPVYLRDAKGNLTDLSTSFEAWGTSAQGEKSVDVTIPDDGKTYSIVLYQYTGWNSNLEMDYVYVTFVRPISVPAALGTNGYATFASPYALDLTTANLGGAKAYKAAIDGDIVRFTEVNQTVPANTGVLIEGTANGTVNIPVVASGSAITGNAFLVNEAGTIFAAGDYNYYGLNKDSDPLTFGLFNPSEVAIPANKAYLKVAKGGAARLSVVFGDESTGISNVSSQMEEGRGYYDLQGRRVAQPTKGLYIVNGKKVIIK